VDKLNGVDEHKRCLCASRLLDNARDIGFAENKQSVTQRLGPTGAEYWLKPLGTEPDLLRTLLARRIERDSTASGDGCRRLHQERAFADPWIAAK
jgi:hypothetical protein